MCFYVSFLWKIVFLQAEGGSLQLESQEEYIDLHEANGLKPFLSHSMLAETLPFLCGRDRQV